MGAPRRHAAAWLAFAAVACLALRGARAQSGEGGGGDEPGDAAVSGPSPLLFSREARGAVGKNLARVAARAGMSAARLDALLTRELDLGFDPAAQSMFYSCGGLAHGHRHGGRRRGGGGGGAAGGLLPLLAAAGGGWGGGVNGTDADAAADAARARRRGGVVALPRRPGGGGATGGGAGGGGGGGGGGAAGSAVPGGPDPVDPSMAFKLHSRPGAPKKILLDFDGYKVRRTVWNFAYSSKRINVPPYSLDDSPEFSPEELGAVIAIWRAVAEDYSPWDVDVTTEDDGSPLTGVGVRAAIGGSYDSVLGPAASPAGGVAYVNTFGQDYFGPALIFAAALNGGSPRDVASVVSHEVGHTLGLSHDGHTPSKQEYYGGHGIWAPIMGSAFGREVVQWSKGEYAGASNAQDDLALISRHLARLPDDHGDAPASATPLPPAAPGGGGAAPDGRARSGAAGAIGRSGEEDWFSFEAGAGPAEVGVLLVPNATIGGFNPVFVRANADMRLRVFAPAEGAAGPSAAAGGVGAAGPQGDAGSSNSSSGGGDSGGGGAAPEGLRLILEADPQGGLLSGKLPVELPVAGRYYISLAGAGDGPGPSVGWSDYGSLGEYRLEVTHPAASQGDAAPSPGDAPPPSAPPGGPGTSGGAVAEAAPPVGVGERLRVELLDYSAARTDAGGARVTRAKLRVTDPSGAPVPGARLELRWSHVPAPPASDGADGAAAAAAPGAAPGQGPQPAFPPAAAEARASGARGGSRGVATASSPYAPSSSIRLEVLSVSPPQGGRGAAGGWRWPSELAAGSDSVVDFTWV
ncbi:hypothetical protein Rsub_05325 [Raphidocelis subcapitata]|uniref:Peptidase metallopeptidase domain-containing protein n=1 Tax=Raphidocelis subcapitata TaxID=307507 RepID=A0A2V0NZZ3_9CHLO|nr:hypothetical protein Rsub_05325 [Raphidocelis subcapitata]|eukprot:GBF92242.1 hypothetical protein Rsub_05325 [Raphidocelis subcapitata]